MPLSTNAILAILRYVVNSIDSSVSQIFREKGDDLQVKCFFLLVDDYIKSTPEDADLHEFDFDRFTTSILGSQWSAVKHRTLADIATQAVSSPRVMTKISIKWANRLADQVVDLIKQGQPEEWARQVEFDNIIKALKELDQVDYQLALVLRCLFSLAERAINFSPKDDLLKKGVAKIMLGPCLKNFIFNSNERFLNGSHRYDVLVLHSNLYQLFNMVALSVLSEKKPFSLSGDVDFTNDQLCHLVFQGMLEPLKRYFDRYPEKVNMTKGIAERSLLHIAAMKNHVEVVKLLLSFKADINARDRIGNRPIDLAVKPSNSAAALFLRSIMDHEESERVDLIVENKI